MIEYVNVAVDAPDGARILAPVTLSLSEQRIAFIGSNGSGKSTLARLINGLADPTQGSMVVNGLDVGRHGREVRRQVGFVFTDPAAQLVMPTVAEDVALSLRGIKSKEGRDAQVQLTLDRFGLADLADRSVHALSGGQRQLVALASVLAVDPAIVVADEPTTLLDLANTRRVAQALFGLSQQLILVTHDLDLALECDRALLIESGQVIADGAPSDVVAHYREHAR